MFDLMKGKCTSLSLTGSKMKGFLSWCLGFCLLAGCGYYGPPLAPEVFSPAAVQQLTATADIDGVELRWEAPQVDLQGKELKSLNGYLVYRREVPRPGETPEEFKVVGEVEDHHIEERERLRKEARAEGRISRHIKVAPELKSFSYRDDTVEAGMEYLYQIRPVNQGGIEGRVQQVVRVLFRGDLSVVNLVSSRGREELEMEVTD